MARTGVLLAVIVAVLLVGVPSATAGKYDLDMTRLYLFDAGNEQSPDQNFKGLMGDLGVALAPRFLGPATTVGALGFQVAFDYSMTNISENADHWKTVMTDPAGGGKGADSFLSTMHLHVRKGLPFSAEVGGTFSKLFNSDMWGVGFEFKYSALEGYINLPEIAFRATVSTYMGSRDFTLLTAGGDVVVSKKIGIVGLFKVAPYVGYNFMYIHGGSNVVLLFNPNNAGIAEQRVFQTAHVLKHFAVLGFQIVSTIVNTGFEASITEGMQTYSFRLGVEF